MARGYTQIATKARDGGSGFISSTPAAVESGKDSFTFGGFGIEVLPCFFLVCVFVIQRTSRQCAFTLPQLQPGYI